MIAKTKLTMETMQPLIVAFSLVVILAIAGVITPGFLTVEHLTMVMYCNTMLGLLAMGQTVVILSGGLDLSIGSIYWITVMVGAMLMHEGNWVAPVLICIGLGAAVGLINGIGIAVLKIPHVVMTLAMMITLTGALYVTTGGGGRGRAAQELIEFSTGRVGGFPIITAIWILLTVVFHCVLKHTPFGWRVRALGSSELASYCSGMRVNAVKTQVYVISGILAAISGLFYLGWARVPYPTFQSGGGIGADLTFNSIAAVIIGGTIFSGGRGGVSNTFLGVLVLSVLYSVLSMAELGIQWQIMLNGVIILAIVGTYSRMRKEA